MIARPGDPVGGGEARRAAREELARREYGHGGPSVAQRVGDWLGRHLGRLLGGGGFGGHALLIFLLLLLAVVVVVVVRAGRPRRTPRADTDGGADPLAPLAAREHRRRAGEYAAAGQHALALREYLRAAVATVEERGVLPPRPGRTGAATAREARPLLPTAADDLATATAVFDEVWFGGREASADDVTRARAAADAVAGARIAGAPDPAAAAGLAVPR